MSQIMDAATSDAMRTPATRTTLVIFLLACGAWGAEVARRGVLERRYREASARDLFAAMELANPARRSTDVIDEARALGGRLFPPRHDEAARLLKAAILRDPMNAPLWFELAREQMLLGELDHARASLARSDALDPRYPAGRMDAIELWDYLGEPQRSREVARQLVALGGRQRTAALRKLIQGGQAPADVFEDFGLGGLGGRELVEALEALATDDRGDMEALFAKIDLSRVDTAELRERAARLTLSPFLPGPAIALWKAHAPGLKLTDAGAPYVNPLLREPPLGAPFPYGWQPVAEGRATLLWSRPGEEDGRGRLAVRVSKESKEPLHWTFHRTPLPAGTGVGVTVRLGADQARTVESWSVRCSAGGTLVPQGTEAVGATGLSREITFDVPPRPEPCLLTLSLKARPSPASTEEAGPVYLEEVSFR